MITNVVVRWRERAGSYRPADETCNFAEYEVARIKKSAAAAFILRHHYLVKIPAARISYGLFHSRTAELRGVAMYSHPQHQNVLTNVFPCDPNEAIELGRFVLLDSVKAHGETQFLRVTFSMLRRDKGILGVVSHSDPMRRTNLDGTEVHKGHHGNIYQAHNARFLGQRPPGYVYLYQDGSPFSPRTKSKVRNLEVGYDGALRELISKGAPPPRPGMDLRKWLDAVLPMLKLRKVRHPGNFKYAWGLTHSMKKHVGPPNPSEYPKMIVPMGAVVPISRAEAA
jgi:hypothetical protein